MDILSAGQIIAASCALVVFYVQLRLSFDRHAPPWSRWGAAVAAVAALYSVAGYVGLQPGQSAFVLRGALQAQHTALSALAFAYAGYVFTYFGIPKGRVLIVTGAVAVVSVALTLATDLVVTRRIEPMRFLVSAAPIPVAISGALVPVFQATYFLSSVALLGLWISRRRSATITPAVWVGFAVWYALGIHDAVMTLVPTFVGVAPLFGYGTVGFAFAILAVTLQEHRLLGERAEAASRAKIRLLAGVSHELRTPLGHLLGFTELVAAGAAGEINDRQRDYLETALRSGRHLLTLVEDVVEFAQTGDEGATLTPEAVEPGRILREALDAQQGAAGERGVCLTARLEALPATVTMDTGKIRRVLRCLLALAIDCVPRGGAVTLNARATTLGRRARALEVRIEGTETGLDHEDLERIFGLFEPVVRSVAFRSDSAIGIGLPLSRLLIGLHGGRLWAGSAGPGRGLGFAFVIPVHPPRQPPATP